MRRWIVISCMVACISCGFAQYFDDLDSLVLSKIDGKWFGGQSFHLERKVLFDKSTTTVLHEPDSGDIVNLLVTHIERNSSDKFLIKYDPGPSADPGYIFDRVKNTDTLYFGEFGADIVIVPGNGFVYTKHRSNEMFNRIRKFKIVDNKFVEVKQPFFWVGIQSELVQDATLYSDTCRINPVAYLGKGQKVFVLVNSGDYYLVKTPLGLTGWIYIKFNDGGIIFDVFPLGD